MNTVPFYARRAFWTSVAGSATAIAAYLAHINKLDWLAGLLGVVAIVCGNIGSVIAADPTTDRNADKTQE